MRLRALLFTLFLTVVAVAAGFGGSVAAAPDEPLSLTPIGTYATGVFFNGDVGAAEIPAYDPNTHRVFVVNAVEKQIDVLDISNPAAPAKVDEIDVAALGTPNSVDVRSRLVAVAIEAPTKTDPGLVAFYRPDGTPLGRIAVGALPDMLTFTPNGHHLLVANEGEAVGAVDPAGSVSVVDLRRGVGNARVATADFAAFDGASLDASVVIGAGKSPSVDLEPEYVTVSDDSRTAWVSLQDANAIAEIDVKAAEVTALRGLGFKDHGLAGNGIDASDRDNAVNICTWPGLYGMYQPDAIASFRLKGRTYVVSANEGDSRAADEARMGALTVSPALTPFRANHNLGRLTLNRTLGAVGGVHEKLFVYGARSFSIWSDTGALVFDSGDQLERIAASFPGGPAPLPPLLASPPVPAAPAATCPLPAPEAAKPLSTPFGANHEESPSFDNRSDNKGPEPESVVVGEIKNRTYAFVGLERLGGVAVYDVTEPAAAEFETYVNPRNFNEAPSVAGAPNPAAGDLGPEGMAFVPKWQSPNGSPLLVVSNEVSGTTTVYRLSGGGL